MSPRVERPIPAYMQITNHFRREILDGTLIEGARILPIAEIAREFEVAAATAAKAITQLQAEGLVYTSPQGTFVAAAEKSANAPHDRLRRVRRIGRTDGTAETARVTAAALVPAPRYVAELLGVDNGTDVVRREWVTTSHRKPSMLSVAWLPPEFARTLPDLLSTEPSTAGTLTSALERVTGRSLTNARDYYEAREADAREAGHLGLRIGSAVLAGTYLWGDDAGVIEYGEFVLPPNRVVSYEYEVSDDADPSTAED